MVLTKRKKRPGGLEAARGRVTHVRRAARVSGIASGPGEPRGAGLVEQVPSKEPHAGEARGSGRQIQQMRNGVERKRNARVWQPDRPRLLLNAF